MAPIVQADEPVSMRVVDLSVGESEEIVFADGKKGKLDLIDLKALPTNGRST